MLYRKIRNLSNLCIRSEVKLIQKPNYVLNFKSNRKILSIYTYYLYVCSLEFAIKCWEGFLGI